MAIRVEGGELYEPKDTDEVRCDMHGIVTTWGNLTGIQQLAVEEGLDVGPELECLLAPKNA